jgi:hypothetical protein
MDDHRRAFMTPQPARRVLGVSQGGEADLGEAHERIGGATAIALHQGADRRTDQGTTLRIEPHRYLPATVSRPRLGEVFTGICGLLVMVNGTQTAHHDLQLGDGSVPRHLDQVVDQRTLTRLEDPTDRAHLRKRQPTRAHFVSQPRI